MKYKMGPIRFKQIETTSQITLFPDLNFVLFKILTIAAAKRQSCIKIIGIIKGKYCLIISIKNPRILLINFFDN